MTLLCRAPRSGPPKTRSRGGLSEGPAAVGANYAAPASRQLVESLSPMSQSRPPAPIASQRLVGGESPTLPMVTTRAPVEITKSGSEAVTVPRLELTVEKENGVPAQRVVLHDGDIARI